DGDDDRGRRAGYEAAHRSLLGRGRVSPASDNSTSARGASRPPEQGIASASGGIVRTQVLVPSVAQALPERSEAMPVSLPGRRSPETGQGSVGAARAGALAGGALAVGAMAAGALAIGALAIGAFAVGRLAIRRLALERGAIGRLAIDELEVGRLRVRELVVDEGAGAPTA